MRQKLEERQLNEDLHLFMIAHGTVLKLMELHESSWNSIKAPETACKPMVLHGEFGKPWVTSGNHGEPSVTLNNLG